MRGLASCSCCLLSELLAPLNSLEHLQFLLLNLCCFLKTFLRPLEFIRRDNSTNIICLLEDGVSVFKRKEVRRSGQVCVREALASQCGLGALHVTRELVGSAASQAPTSHTSSPGLV